MASDPQVAQEAFESFFAAYQPGADLLRPVVPEDSWLGQGNVFGILAVGSTILVYSVVLGSVVSAIVSLRRAARERD